MAWFGCLLSALLVASLMGRDACVKAAAAALLFNWVFNTALAAALGSQDQWMVMAAVDWSTAVVLVMVCGGKLRVALAATYAVQMLTHGAYGAHQWLNGVTYTAQVAYWDGLFAVALGQAFIVGGWIVGGGLRHYRLHRRGQLSDPSMPVPVARRGHRK